MFEVNLFGEANIVDACGNQVEIPRGKTLELFSYLLINPDRSCARSVIASALRAETSEQSARRALSTDIWRLRAFLSDCGIDPKQCLSTKAAKVELLSKFVRTDVTEFICTINEYVDRGAETLRAKDMQKLEATEAMYSDVFLPEIDTEWSIIFREKIRSKYIVLLELLLTVELENDRWISAIRWAETLIRRDPLYEKAHRALIQCYYLSGERALAIRQYEKCARILREELNCAPDEQTQKMYRGLVAVPGKIAQEGAAISPLQMIESEPDIPLTDHLSRALSNINQAGSLIELVDKKLRTQPR